MHHKYKLGNYAITDSKIWKEIGSIAAELLPYSFWQIGKGMVKFWSQRWWPMEVEISRSNNLPDDFIGEIWSDDNRKLEYINSLPTELQQYARKIQISNSEDQLIWQPTEDGVFSSKSFRLLQTQSNGSDYLWWKKFWQAWIPSKCSCFLWRCLHHAVPVDDEIQRTGIPLVSKCVCCINSQQESLNHLFLFSEVAKDVWRFLHSIFDSQFIYLDLRQAANIWINNSSTKSQFGCLRILAFVVALWEIWKWRNRCIFDKPESSSSIKRRIVLQLQQAHCLISPSKDPSWAERIAISCLQVPVIRTVRKGRWFHWISNSQSYTVNFHGKIKGNSGAGSFLIRDNKGNVSHSKTFIVSNTQDLFYVAIFSLEEALSLAANEGINLAEIQCDSSKVIKCLSGVISPPWRWFDRIAVMRKNCQGSLLKIVEQQQNWAAILLADKAESGGLENLDVQKALLEDKRGFPRWSWL